FLFSLGIRATWAGGLRSLAQSHQRKGEYPVSVTDVEYPAAASADSGWQGVPRQARRRGPATRCPPPPAAAAVADAMRELAEDVTCLVHAGRPRSAGVLLAELDPAALHELVLVLAATRRPQWIREGNDVDEVLVERAINGAP